MSLFGGGGGGGKPKKLTSLATQTSSGSVPITLAYGKNRIAPNIIWQGDFKAHKHKQGGKGGPSITSYTYSASFELGLCWGEIHDVTRAWKENSKKTSYTSLGMTLFKGPDPQAPWGYLVSKHPTEALGYPGIAYLAVAKYDLGQSNALPQHSFEVESLLWHTGVGGTVDDADPALMIDDFLSHPVHGIGFDTAILSNLLSTVDAPTTGDSAMQTYAQARGWALSPSLIQQEEAGAILERWAKLCDTAIAWTGYTLKFHPYGPNEITANGVTYLPDFPIRYTLTDKDYLYEQGSDPITMDRVDPADAFNSYNIIISNRANEYNDLPVSWRDQGLVDQFTLRKADSMDAKEICVETMAQDIISFIGQRGAYVRNSFNFKLGPQFCRLEPMDILQCYDPRWGFFNVLIREITEDDDDLLSFICDEYPESVSGNSATTAQTIINTPMNTGVDAGPVNTPIIFEPPSSLSGGNQIWAVVSGGDDLVADPMWGGANVFISTDDITYSQIGSIEQPMRQGKLTAILATYGGSNPDTVHTLAVDLAMSEGELIDANSAADAAAGATLCYVDGEFISFQTATLTTTFGYNITNLYRGLYGSTIGAHASGTQFGRLDDTVFKFDLPAAYIGIPLYLKFQSFNPFNDGVQDISTCTAYLFTPDGTAFGTGTGGAPSTPAVPSGSAGTTFAKLTWTGNSVNDNITGYQVWRATGSGASFGSASIVGTVPASAREFSDTSVTGGQAYTYFLVAVNVIGSSGNTAGINLTPVAAVIINPYGFAFQNNIGFIVVSKPVAYFDSPVAYTLPISLTDSQGTIGDSTTATATAPSAQTDFDIQSPVGTSIGTMRFAASSLTATFIKAASSSISLGQPLVIVAPANLNGMAGTLYGSIKGTR